MAKKVIDALLAKFGDAVTAPPADAPTHGDEVVYVKADRLRAVAEFLKADKAMAFDAPVLVTAIDLLDWGAAQGDVVAAVDPAGVAIARDADGNLVHRFQVVWGLRSTAHRHRLRLKVNVTEASPKAPSLADLWVGFNWQERETFDMYGIQFEGHPDLRRIYLYDEFVGYPLRKDYPKDKRQPLVRRDDLPGHQVRQGDL